MKRLIAAAVLKTLSVVVLLALAWVPAQSQNVTFSCGPKVNQQTCEIASKSFLQLTDVVSVGSLRRITILDPDSYTREKLEDFDRNPPDMNLQVLSGPYKGNVLFESEGNSVCPSSVFFSSDIVDESPGELVLDEKGQLKLGSNGRVVMRYLPPTSVTKTIQALGLASFIDGYSQACSNALLKTVTMQEFEKERNRRK